MDRCYRYSADRTSSETSYFNYSKCFPYSVKSIGLIICTFYLCKLKGKCLVGEGERSNSLNRTGGSAHNSTHLVHMSMRCENYSAEFLRLLSFHASHSVILVFREIVYIFWLKGNFTTVYVIFAFCVECNLCIRWNLIYYSVLHMAGVGLKKRDLPKAPWCSKVWARDFLIDSLEPHLTHTEGKRFFLWFLKQLIVGDSSGWNSVIQAAEMTHFVFVPLRRKFFPHKIVSCCIWRWIQSCELHLQSPSQIPHWKLGFNHD